MIEHASELRGVLIISREEGAQLGTVTGININPASKSICAIRFRPKNTRGESFVEMKDVQLIGQDVVLVTSETAAKTEDAPGKNLEDLQGSWVTTLEGKHLGTLVDVDFQPGDWLISELTLSDGKSLPVEAAKVTIGDEILVPAAYENKVQAEPEKPGVMSRIFGTDTIERMKHTLTRALSGQEKNEEEKKKE